MVIKLDVSLFLNLVCYCDQIELFFYYYSIGNGSDAGAASTTVKEHDASNYIMNGTKSWMFVTKNKTF
jgi:hypothetical protein